jgi:1-deoxy-D-xylulose-5-phosphate reductoisomerase
LFSLALKNIVIFGSTGSIGKNCLEVVSRFPDRFKVLGLSAKSNIELLAQQALKFKVAAVAIADENYYLELKKSLPSNLKVFSGAEGIAGLLDYQVPIQLVVNAMVGFAGLFPSLKVLEKGITLALANKESLVAAGKIVLEAAHRNRALLLPIDSEHSAIFQCLLGEERSTIDKLILTASGGPFLDYAPEEFSKITPEQALKHPNWDMGPRITIDSATLANKGFEVIEAHYLFNIAPERIEVVIHRQSLIHSLVRFSDGSYKSQLSAPDMRLPIQFALTYPERLPSPYGNIDFSRSIALDFQPVPENKFPCLKLAHKALKQGGVAPAVLNAADETAVEAFLQKRITFDRIPALIAQALEKAPVMPSPTLEDIFKVDKEVRLHLTQIIENW